MLRISIGKSDFEEIRTNNYYFVDKSMLIADVVRSGAEVLLLPRPRRFGKTLNLSMLHTFFKMNGQDNRSLFADLAVSRHQDVMAHCGAHPTVFLTFKDNKWPDFQDFLDNMGKDLSRVFLDHLPTLEEANPRYAEKHELENILERKAGSVDLSGSLALLTRLLHRATGKKAIVLIDEYDMPVHSGFNHGYYDDVISFMRNFLSSAFKDNNSLHKAVLTGIMRIAKESIFSGFNNPDVLTLLDHPFASHFGFTDEEVVRILRDTNQIDRLDEVRAWYNGYRIGSETIYNPWSIMNFAEKPQSPLESHWINTSDNKLIQKLITEEDALSKDDLEKLLRGETFNQVVEPNIVLGKMTARNLWGIFLFSGYLTPRKTVVDEGRYHCDLAIPNLEVRTFYEITVKDWIEEQTSSRGLEPVLTALLNEDMEGFTHHFVEAVRQMLSFHDTSGNVPERVYQSFLLGILVLLRKDYHVRSNRESGLGRYDISMIPRTPSGTGFLFEFKQTGANLQETAAEALQQIRDNDYAAELRESGISRIRAIGVAMSGKQAALETALL